MILLAVFFSCLAMLAPFLSIDIPWGSEVWVYQAVRELNRGFHLAPLLNGYTFNGPNPLVPVILSLLPFSDLMSLRIVCMLAGGLVSLSVFVFAASLWGNRAGFWSALFTMTSLGFVAGFASLNTTAIPSSIAIVAFLLFAQIYLTELNPWWYLLSYVLITAAAITGGWIPVAFFAFSVIFLILLDMAPKKLLSIKASYLAILLGSVIVVVYLVTRFFEGPAYAGSIFSSSSEISFSARLMLWTKFNLPWLLLVIPAWISSEGPKEAPAWRAQLAPKTGYAIGLCAVLFTGHAQEGYAVLSIPFGAIIIGYWMAKNHLIRQGIRVLRTVSVTATALIVIMAALTLISLGSFIRPLKELSFGINEALILASFFAAATALVWLMKKQHTTAIVILCMVSCLALSWYSALVLIPGKAEKPLAYISGMSPFTPLLVFRDDLLMRGYTGFVGARAIVVDEKMVPVGDHAYLAVRTDDLDALTKDLTTRMHVRVVSSFDQSKTYALLRVATPAPRQ